MINPDTDHPQPPTDKQLKDNAQQLAWLALGFFQALLEGKARFLIEEGPRHDGSLIAKTTRIYLEWPGKPPEETV